MDVGYFSSSSVEAQMDLEAMMMQLEKLPDFPPTEAPLPAAPVMEFPWAGPLPPLIDTLLPTPPLSTVSTPPTTVSSSSGMAFQQDLSSVPPTHPNSSTAGQGEPDCEARTLRHRRTPMAAMREMVFSMAAMQPVHIDPESVRPPKRRNVRISKDPQSVAARHRRERISERIRILQRLVPGGTKMDTASMLDEAIHYVKFLKTQVQSLEMVAAAGGNVHRPWLAFGFGGLGLPAAAVAGRGFSCSSGSSSS